MQSITYGVREFQARLGEALRAVASGKVVVITSRGRPVGMLVKPTARVPEESALDRKLRRLAAEGRIRLGSGQPIRPFKAFPGTGLTRQVLSDRS